MVRPQKLMPGDNEGLLCFYATFIMICQVLRRNPERGKDHRLFQQPYRSWESLRTD
jgi:hypothetical protein